MGRPWPWTSRTDPSSGPELGFLSPPGGIQPNGHPAPSHDWVASSSTSTPAVSCMSSHKVLLGGLLAYCIPPAAFWPDPLPPPRRARQARPCSGPPSRRRGSASSTWRSTSRGTAVRTFLKAKGTASGGAGPALSRSQLLDLHSANKGSLRGVSQHRLVQPAIFLVAQDWTPPPVGSL